MGRTAFAPGRPVAGGGVHRPDAAAPQVGDIERLRCFIQRKAGGPGDAGQDGLHRAGGGVVDVDAAGAGVGGQFGAQGALHAVPGAGGGKVGEVDRAVRCSGHCRGAGEGAAVDLAHDELHRHAPLVAVHPVEPPALRFQRRHPDGAVRCKGEIGDLACRRQHFGPAGAVRLHPQQAAILAGFGGGVEPAAVLPQGGDLRVGGQFQSAAFSGGLRPGLLPDVRCGVGRGCGFDGTQHQPPDEGRCSAEHKDDAQLLEPLQHLFPLGGALGLLRCPAAGRCGAGLLGAAHPAVHPERCTGADGQRCDEQDEQQFNKSDPHGGLPSSGQKQMGIRIVSV